ncbi:MAG TPA: sulfotransferase [Candidatus Binatia bacterium]
MDGKIFGVGLSKTGTTSLHHAFKALGFSSTHFPKIPQAFAGRFRCVDDYDAASDISVVPYYPQFDAVYPGSKFILTVRKIDDWLASMETWWRRERKPTEYMIRVRLAVFGIHTFNPDRLKYVYEKHVADVGEYFKDRPGDLLTLNICAGEGWEKLCPFLSRPIPDADFPFVVPGGKTKKRAVLGLFGR